MRLLDRGVLRGKKQNANYNIIAISHLLHNLTTVFEKYEFKLNHSKNNYCFKYKNFSRGRGQYYTLSICNFKFSVLNLLTCKEGIIK